MFLLIALLILYVLYIYFKTKKRCDLAEKFPGPPVHPIFGNIFNFFCKDLLVFKQRVHDAHKKYGDVFRLKFVRNYLFYVCDATIAEQILSSSTHYSKKASHYKFIGMLLGKGLVTSNGEHWQNHRKIIMPAFNYNYLKKFINVFDRQSQVLVEKLTRKCDGKVLDIREYADLMALDIITETAMGTRINAQSNDNSEYVKAVERSKYIATERITSFWRRIDILYSTIFYKEKKVQDQIYGTVRKLSNDIIAGRREYLMKKKCAVSNESPENEDYVSNRNEDSVFIDVLLQATINGKPLSNEEILDETHTFMIAGHDTTATALSAVLYLLSRHKRAQDNLFNEIILKIGKDKFESPTYQQLQSLNYMDMVIKESMRLFPPIPLIGRLVDHDLKLVDGRVIPAGVDIRLNFSHIFTSPKYFEDPEKFIPERFDINSTYKVHPFAFTPFSYGLRNCIGQKFAILSIKAALIKLIQNFEFIPMGDAPILSFEVVTRAVNGMQLAIKLRSN